MTSIIGYTRVPFNSSASKHFSIAPVQQLYQNNKSVAERQQQQQQQQQQQKQQQQQLCVVKNDCHDSNNTRRPTYHRMFSREMSQHGIIELIIDNKKKKQDNKNFTISSNNKQDNKIINNTNNGRRLSYYKDNYNILLSIDLNTTHDYDNLSSSTTEDTNDNLQKLMDAISRIAQEKTIHFVHILNLLKKLQLQQSKHRFMSCIDKYNSKILVYFPSTISYTSVDQTYEWLKYSIDVDIDRFKHWTLSTVDNQEVHTTNKETAATFDGDNYFNDIHLFIDHIDSLIESDGLFSHKKSKRTNNKSN